MTPEQITKSLQFRHRSAARVCSDRAACFARIGDLRSVVFCHLSMLQWETDFYPVPVLGRIALSLRGCQAPALDKNRAPMGPEILSSTGTAVWRKAPKAFPDSSSYEVVKPQPSTG